MTPMALALGILAVTIICFIWEPFPIAVTAILASLSYGFFGIVKMNTVFAAYDNNTNILLAGMMIVGASLFHTGITDAIGKKMVALTGKKRTEYYFGYIDCFLYSQFCLQQYWSNGGYGSSGHGHVCGCWHRAIPGTFGLAVWCPVWRLRHIGWCGIQCCCGRFYGENWG